jgi:DNA-binding transcriptional ArsR family regulator
MRADLYHPEKGEISLDRVLAALADPIRRDIATRLYKDGPLLCGQLSYPIAKSTLSHHLKVMRESGVMRTEVLGTHRRVILRREDLNERFPRLLDAVGVTQALPTACCAPTKIGSPKPRS